MTATNNPPDLESILRDLAALKKDVAALAEHAARSAAQATGEALGGGAEETGEAHGGSATQAGQSAAHTYNLLSSECRRVAGAVARHVEEQPVTSLLLAFGLGVLGSHLLTRRGS